MIKNPKLFIHTYKCNLKEKKMETKNVHKRYEIHTHKYPILSLYKKTLFLYKKAPSQNQSYR